MAERSKARVCGQSLASIAGSSLPGGIDFSCYSFFYSYSVGGAGIATGLRAGRCGVRNPPGAKGLFSSHKVDTGYGAP